MIALTVLQVQVEELTMTTGSNIQSDVNAVIADIETFTHCLIEGSFDEWLRYWDEDGVLMPPGRASIVRRESIGDYVRENFHDVTSMTLSNWDVDVAGDLATAASDVTWHTRSGDGGTLKQVMVLRRTADGRWIRKRVIYNEPGSG